MTVVALLVCAEVPATATDTAGPWADIDGHPLIWHAARRLREAGVTTVFLVCGPERAAAAAAITGDLTFGGSLRAVVTGSDDGFRTAVAAALADDPSVVLVHDPTRAFAPVGMIRRVIDAVRDGAPVVIPVLPVVDTIRAVGTDGQASALVDRDALRIVQTPQGFAPAALRRRHHLGAGDPSNGVRPDHEAPGMDEAAAAVLAGEPLAVVPGHADAARVLTAGEIDQARRALRTPVTMPATADHRADSRG